MKGIERIQLLINEAKHFGLTKDLSFCRKPNKWAFTATNTAYKSLGEKLWFYRY